MHETAATILRMLVPALYAVVSAGYIASFLRNKPTAYSWARIALLSGVVCHTILLIILVVQHRGFPLDTVFRGLFFCSWILSLFVLAARRILREPAYGAFLFPINLAAVLIASLFLSSGTPLPRIMQSYYFAVHVALLFTAYACFLFSCIVSVMFLLQHNALRTRALKGFFHRLPALDSMDQTVMRADALGLMLLITGMAMGFLWAFVALGSAENLSIKIGLSLLTAVVYSAEHVLRFSKGWEGQRACLISIAGFLMVVCTLIAGHHGF